MNDTENDVRVYEIGYWLVPTIAEEAVEDQVTELKHTLKTHGAEIISEEAPYLREIAYEMCKVINNQNQYFNEGYFGWIKFEMDPAQTLELKKKLELDENIIRALTTQTVKENTVYTKRPASLKKEGEETEVETETVPEEVNEEIEVVEDTEIVPEAPILEEVEK